MTTQQTTLDRFLDSAAELTAVVDAVPADRWSAPSPCEGWTAADVLDHVIDTQRDFLARHALLDSDRPAGSPASAWARHRESVRALLADPQVGDREFDGFFGRTTIGATLADFYGFDMVVHRWDLARAVGQETSFSEAELDRLEDSIEGFGDMLYAEGICAPPVAVGPDSSRPEKVLGLLGRRAG